MPVSMPDSLAFSPARSTIPFAASTWVTCAPALAVLFIIIGNYMPKCKQNFTIGIKIPTTLNSEENWNATHRVAGVVWVICGILLLPLVFLPERFLPFTLIAVIPAILIPTIYSIVYDKKHK